MALQFMIGGSGSGKSYRLYQDVIEQSAKHPEKKYLVLVPEQFTMQTQKDLVAMHPNHGIMNIDILSFQRLAYHVFDELGMNDKLILEDTGKSLVLRRLAGLHRGELEVLGSKLDRMEYIGQVKSVLTELEQYHVKAEQLEMLERELSGEGLLPGKLHDILLLMKEFDEYKKDRYITAEETLEVLAGVVSQSAKVQDAVIVLDGFTGFTPVQYLLLARLMKCAAKMTVTVTLDPDLYPFRALHEEELFALGKRTIWDLERIAQEEEVPVLEPIVLREGMPRFANNPEMTFLEKHILRYDHAVYSGETEAVRIFRGATPKSEIDFVTKEILRLVREEGYRFRDIAVITGDMENYGESIRHRFAQSRIACFVDHKGTILADPMVEYLRAALAMIVEHFSYDSVFRFLRCGMNPMEASAVDQMENYCRAMGIRGYKNYAQQWIRLPRYWKEEDLLAVNETRVQFLSRIEALILANKGRGITVLDRTTALYEFCVKEELQKKMKQISEKLLEKGNLTQSKAYEQTYRLVMELLDKLAQLIGDEVISTEEYAKILDAGFEEIKVGIIPPGNDQVIVGDLQRTRLKYIKALFVIGVNDGIIPKASDHASILSELDRERLKKEKVKLSPDRRENAFIQQFYLYMNLTKPSQRLYLGYSAGNRKGETIRPSYLIGHLVGMYPNIEIEEVSSDHCPKDICSSQDGFLALAQALERGDFEDFENPYLQALMELCAEDEEGREILKKLLMASGRRESRLTLDQACAKALYGDALHGSVTRLEKYAACAYAHFLSYGLSLKPRQEFTFDVPDFGQILHNALELYTVRLEKSEYDWFDVPEDVQTGLMDECVDMVAADYGNTILKSSARNENLINRMKKLGRKSIQSLTSQVRRGSFVPKGFEVAFSGADHLDSVRYDLGGDRVLTLSGRIDRTDICETEDNVYVKVIDYKTGEKELNVRDVYDGINLQLVIYMNAALEMEERTHTGKEAVPAAILYYQLKDPLVPRTALPQSLEEEEKIASEVRKELKNRGYVNSDPDIIKLIDKNAEAPDSSIPVVIKKDGSFREGTKVASTDMLKLLGAHARKKVTQFGQEILKGRIDINPYKDGQSTSCAYCDYKGICEFNTKIPGFGYRGLTKADDAIVWAIMEDEQKAEEAPRGEIAYYEVKEGGDENGN